MVRLAVAFAALLLATMLVLTPSGAVSAREGGDACGNELINVPDRGASFDFTLACEAHDACYVESVSLTSEVRRSCDSAFLSDMLGSCTWPRGSLNYFSCATVARIYYTGVRIGGWLFS